MRWMATVFYKIKAFLFTRDSLKKDLHTVLDQSSTKTGITTLVIGATEQCMVKAAT